MKSAPRCANSRGHDTGRIVPMPRQTCSIEGCSKASYVRGWCCAHYTRWKRYGDPLRLKPRPTVEDRFWAKVDKRGSDECWQWTAVRSWGGYGLFNDGRAHCHAHRFAYELLVGPIPEGKQLDHLCRNRTCVNPAHLEPVTQQENIRRGDCGKHTREKTHCPQGHPYAGDNLYVTPDGRRECRQCRRAAQERFHRKKRAQS